MVGVDAVFVIRVNGAVAIAVVEAGACETGETTVDLEGETVGDSEGEMVAAGMGDNKAWELETRRQGSIWSSVMAWAGFNSGAFKCQPGGPQVQHQ
jgi:hypothetical protein